MLSDLGLVCDAHNVMENLFRKDDVLDNSDMTKEEILVFIRHWLTVAEEYTHKAMKRIDTPYAINDSEKEVYHV